MLIALTGGIGSGKSTVAAEWTKLGATEIDADILAREVVKPGAVGLETLVQMLGEEILTSDGQLDRSKLASVTFTNPEVRTKVEQVLHPLIQQLAKVKTEQTEGIVVYTIPLLVETKSPLEFDAVVTISCPESVRVERLIARGMSEQDARNRISAQATDQEREAVADYVLDSNCSMEELKVRAQRLFEEITSG
ncbi:MAG: dephospho-CoA kinase [Aquiluna sp.]